MEISFLWIYPKHAIKWESELLHEKVEIYAFFLYLSFLIKVLNDTSDPIVDVCGISIVIVSRRCSLFVS